MPLIRSEQDLQAGLEALARLDGRLSPIIAKAGPLPLRLLTPGFEGLANIIVSQVISKAAASAIWRRMEASGAISAEGFLNCPPDAVNGFGLSRAKLSTLLGVAEAVDTGRLDLAALSSLAPSEALGALMQLKGVGLWTAEVYLMFCEGHADVFPAGDVALRAAVAHGLMLETRPSIAQTVAIASDWQPWRSVAARLFWAYYAAHMGRSITPLA
ncbi:DNA-3-methyladenine glycosylase family protein [Rhizobium helianthi]|uniref:DNA-3-methyladenine glycosylase II n=1 Tax=Rhizobium helianthi TaxID=1132695 RepID=A0ABW4M135_9HYPH